MNQDRMGQGRAEQDRTGQGRMDQDRTGQDRIVHMHMDHHRLRQVPLPLLVTGVAGVPGYNALEYFHSLFPGQVIGLRRRDNWRLAAPHIAGCDAEESEVLQRLFDEHRFAAVLNCAGNCALKACELDPDRARRINVVSAENLLRVLERSKANGGRHAGRGPVRLIHLSVDLVYPGRNGGSYVETDAIDPVTVYGKTMAESEEVILSGRPDACVLRISLPMGVSFNGHAGAIDWIQSRFKAGKPATLFTDEIRTPTYTDCLNDLLHELLTNDLSGLFHAGSPRRMTLFEIAQVVNRVGGYDPRLLHGVLRSAAGPMPPRAGDVTMDSSKLVRALGRQPFDLWPFDDCWMPTDAHWHWRREHEPGSPALLNEVLYRNPRRRASRQAV